MPLKIWRRLESRERVRNDYWAYCVDTFAIDQETRGEYHYVHSPGSTMVVPVTRSKKMVMITQYRYLNDRVSIEFPCGGVKPELGRLDNALKELREETGFTAGSIRQAGEFTPYTGAADEICTVYIAEDLAPAPLPPDATEEFEMGEYSLEEIQAMIDSNTIWDGLTLAAWALVQHQLKQILNEA